MDSLYGKKALEGFQLNRINPSGGEMDSLYGKKALEGFQLNRINPSGGVVLLLTPLAQS